MCVQHRKELVLYVSMGFGNPYGDAWNTQIVQQWVERLQNMGIRIFQLSDTIGVATPENITYLFNDLIPANPGLEIGAHFHTTPAKWREKVHAAWQAGCRRFDGAIKGYGGCPMAKDELVGNMPMELLLRYLEEQGYDSIINEYAFSHAYELSASVFRLDSAVV